MANIPPDGVWSVTTDITGDAAATPVVIANSPIDVTDVSSPFIMTGPTITGGQGPTGTGLQGIQGVQGIQGPVGSGVTTTFASFAIPAYLGTVTITVAAAADLLVGLKCVLTDGASFIFAHVTGVSGTSITVANKGGIGGGVVSGTMAAGRLYLTGGTFDYNSLNNAPVTATSTTGGLVTTPPNDITKVYLGNAAFGTLLYSSLGSIPTSFAPISHQSTHTQGGTDVLPLVTGGTSHYYDYEDFMGSGVGYGKFTIWNNGAGTGAISAIPAPTSGVNGTLQLSPGTTASSYARLYAGGICLSTTTATWRARINVINAGATSATQHVMGFSSLLSAVISTTGYYVAFYYLGSTGTNWQALVRSLTLATTVDTGVNVTSNLNTYFDLKIVATSTSCLFYINSSLVVTTVTNIPPATVTLNPCIFLANGSDTTNRSVLIDSVEIDLDSGIAGKFMKTGV